MQITRFPDRRHAALLLAEALHDLRATHPLVLAIPRGGLVLGEVLARELNGELDVVLVRKLGSPFDPEYAIGAIDETGWTWFPPGSDPQRETGGMLEQIKTREMRILQQRRQQYAPFAPRRDPAGRTVVVVDDGLATGATMLAALHAIREARPSLLVCAVPVAAPDSLELVRPQVDRLVCLLSPPDFGAVGRYYDAFPQVSDDEARDILARVNSRPA